MKKKQRNDLNNHTTACHFIENENPHLYNVLQINANFASKVVSIILLSFAWDSSWCEKVFADTNSHAVSNETVMRRNC